MSTTHQHAPKLGAAIAIGAAALLLAGCSQPALAPDEFADVRAVLDRTAQRIELPLDRYLMSDSEMRTVEHANAILIDECMEDAGFDYPAADGDWAAIAPTSERRTDCGAWNRRRSTATTSRPTPRWRRSAHPAPT